MAKRPNRKTDDAIETAKKGADWLYLRILVPLSVVGGALALFIWLFDITNSSNDPATREDLISALEGKRVVNDEELRVMVMQIIETQSGSADTFTGFDARLIAGGSRDVLSSLDEARGEIRVILAQGRSDDAADALETLAAGEADTLEAAKTWREAAMLNYTREPVRARLALQRSVELNPDDYWAWLTLSRVCYLMDDASCAWPAAQEAVRLARDAEQKAAAQISLGNGMMITGEMDGAVTAFETAVRTIETLTRLHPDNIDYARLEVDALKTLYSAYDWIEAYEKSEATAGQALEAARRLYKLEPSDWVTEDIALLLVWYGDALYFGQNDVLGGKAAYQEALLTERRLAEKRGNHPDDQFSLLFPLKRLGDLARSEDDKQGQRAAYEEMLQINERLYQSEPGEVYAGQIAFLHGRLARLNGPDAQAHWQAAYDTLKAEMDSGRIDPDDEFYREDLEFYASNLEETEQ